MKIITRKFLLLSTLLLSFTAAVQAETIMRVGTWLPPSHPQNTVVFPQWGKWIEEATEGRVKLKLEYDLGHPKKLFQLAEDGVIDAGWSFHGFVPGRFNATQVVELPLLGVGPEAASVAFWQVYNSYFLELDEHAGVELAALFTHGPGQMHLKQPVTSLADLENRKIRIGGGIQAEIGKRLEITPVSAPGSKVYEMMQQGVVDGVFIPALEQKGMRLHEVAPYLVSLPGGMYLGSFAIFFSPDFLDSLSDEDREAILAVSGEKLSALAGRAWGEADEAGYAEAEKRGVNVLRVGVDDPLYKEYEARVQGMDSEWVDRMTKRGVDNAGTALEALRRIARDYEANQQE